MNGGGRGDTREKAGQAPLIGEMLPTLKDEKREGEVRLDGRNTTGRRVDRDAPGQGPGDGPEQGGAMQ